MKKAPKVDDVVLSAIEREQQRIGNQLHEKLCQTLAGISIQVGLMTAHAQDSKAVKVAEVELLGRHIQDAIDQARALSGDLRALNLEGTGLLQALGNLADNT